MIVSHEHKYLFVEVPHTASTAISRELRTHYGGQSILYKHANYTEFRRSASRDERTYFTFAAVRNPLDAVVTAYFKFLTNHCGAYTDEKQFERNGGWIPEEELDKFRFIRDTDATFDTFLQTFFHSVYNNWYLLNHHRFDFVMRFENIQSDFARALQRLGIERVKSLPAVNKTSRSGGFEEQYSAEVRDLALRVFGPFMEKWGYEFPPEWEVGRVPLSSKIKFRLIDAAANLVARHFTLSPRNRFLARVKTLTDQTFTLR